MKRIFFLFMILISYNVIAQEEIINTIIFVDGQLRKIENAYFSYKDSTGKERKLEFNYNYGEIHIKKEYKKEIGNLKCGLSNDCINKDIKEDSLYINFTITECQGNCSYNYRKLIPSFLLDTYYNYYLIIRVMNLNKKRTKYSIYYTTPTWEYPFEKKEKKVIFIDNWDWKKWKCK